MRRKRPSGNKDSSREKSVNSMDLNVEESRQFESDR